MSAMTDIAFTDAVKAAQERFGTRDACRFVEDHGRVPEISEDLAKFIATRDSVYLATASAGGRPYIQHRGGPKGFIKVLDAHTLGFAEYPGNQQLITAGNLSENPHAFLFMMDYATAQRVKIWGRAEIVDKDAEFAARVFDEGLPLATERALKFTLEAWDLNCRKYITARYSEEDVKAATAKLTQRIAELEAEVERLKGLTP